MKKFMKKLLKKAEGFTLVELIVVIAILGILAAVAVPAYSGYLKKANETASITECDAIKTAAQAALATYGEVTAIEIDDGVVKATYKSAAGADVTVTMNASTDVANETYDNDFKTFFTSTVSTKFHSDLTKATWSATANNGDWTFVS